MRGWKRAAGVAAALAVSTSAGVAWANTQRQDAGVQASFAPLPGGPARVLGAGRTGTKLVALTPCRLVDTRQGTNAPMIPNEVRKFDVRGSGGLTFTQQGGKATGCGIPTSGVSAVEITVTAVDASGTGFIRVYPSTEPTATFINYTPTFNPSNTGTVTICSAGCAADDDIVVKNYGTSTDVVIDVQGYFEQPIAAMVASNGTLTRGSRVSGAARLAEGVYQVSFDREIESCAWHGGLANTAGAGTIGQIGLSDDGGSTTDVRLITRNSTGANADLPFFVEVVC